MQFVIFFNDGGPEALTGRVTLRAASCLEDAAIYLASVDWVKAELWHDFDPPADSKLVENIVFTKNISHITDCKGYLKDFD